MGTHSSWVYPLMALEGRSQRPFALVAGVDIFGLIGPFGGFWWPHPRNYPCLCVNNKSKILCLRVREHTHMADTFAHTLTCNRLHGNKRTEICMFPCQQV